MASRARDEATVVGGTGGEGRDERRLARGKADKMSPFLFLSLSLSLPKSVGVAPANFRDPARVSQEIHALPGVGSPLSTSRVARAACVGR